MRRGIVQQQKRTQLASQTVVIKHGTDRKTVADPVRSRTLMDAKQFLHGVLSSLLPFFTFT